MSVKLQKKLQGRVEMCLNTARVHPDWFAREENRVRAQAYMNAQDDALNDDECNALIALHKMVVAMERDGGLQGPQFKPVRDILSVLEKIWTDGR